jgi:hypothetical protein
VTVAADRALDDLDRLAYRLLRTVRRDHPSLLEHGFTLADLEGRLLPFRDTRREMADTSAESWELALLRLVSGERDYLEVDHELSAAARQALTMPAPTVALIRPWATSAIRVGAAARALSPTGTDETTTPPMTGGSLGAHTAAISTRSCTCRYCGGRLPEQRRVAFCPHCGLDVTKRHCPACSTELDVSWRFCVTCGRGADVAGLYDPQGTGSAAG